MIVSYSETKGVRQTHLNTHTHKEREKKNNESETHTTKQTYEGGDR